MPVTSDHHGMKVDSTHQAACRSTGFGRCLFAILAVACLARVGILLYAEHRPGPFEFPDADRYLTVARNVAAGLGPIDSDQVRAGTDPLYPCILSIGVLLGCETDAASARFGRIVNALFGIASVGLLACLARRLVGDRAALVASGILALDPVLLFFNATVLTETCHVLLLLCAFCCVVRQSAEHRVLWAVAAGLSIGLATLTRSSSLFLPILMVPLVWHFAHGTHRARAAATACFLIATAATLVPTTVRNHGLSGHLVPVRTGSGASLMEALGPWADGGPGMDRIVYPDFPPDADEFVRDRICRQAAWDWARDHPDRTGSLSWTKLRRTWSVTINAAAYSSGLFVAVAWLTVAPEFALAVAGLWVLRRRPWVILLLGVVAIYFTLVHVVFVGSVRYRVPAMPFLFVVGGAAVDRLWGRIARDRAP